MEMHTSYDNAIPGGRVFGMFECPFCGSTAVYVEMLAVPHRTDRSVSMVPGTVASCERYLQRWLVDPQEVMRRLATAIDTGAIEFGVEDS